MPKTIEVRIPCDGEVWRKGQDYYIFRGSWMMMHKELYEIMNTRISMSAMEDKLVRITEDRPCSAGKGGVFDGHDGWKFVAENWIDWVRKGLNKELDYWRKEIAEIKKRLKDLK